MIPDSVEDIPLPLEIDILPDLEFIVPSSGVIMGPPVEERGLGPVQCEHGPLGSGIIGRGAVIDSVRDSVRIGLISRWALLLVFSRTEICPVHAAYSTVSFHERFKAFSFS